MTPQQKKAQAYLKATKQKLLDEINNLPNKKSTSIRIATRQNKYNDEVRAYAKKNKLTLQKATLALMTKEPSSGKIMKQLKGIPFTTTLHDRMSLTLEQAEHMDPKEYKFIYSLYINFDKYNQITHKQYNFFLSLEDNYV